MAYRTQGCGAPDTVLRRGYSHDSAWAVRDVRLRVLAGALVIAGLLHGPLIPNPLAALLRVLFRTVATEEPVPLDTEVVVPIELDTAMFGQDPGSPAGTAADDDEEIDSDGWDLDGGVDEDDDISIDDFDDDEDDEDDEGDDELDAGAPDGAVADAAPAVAMDAGGGDEAPDAGEEPAAPDAGTPGPGKRLADPNAVAGGPSAVTAKHPNVRVYLASDRIREHPMGPKFGELLVTIPEWAEVIGGTGLDPMRDFDHVLLSGPQFRDPSYVVAVMDFNVSVGKMRRAVERSMANSKPRGKWLSGHDMPVGSLGHEGYRRAVLLPDKRIFVLLPTSAEEQIPKLKSLKPFKKSGQAAIVLYLLTPWRAFRGTPVAVPKRIKWMRLSLIPIDAGGGPASGGYNLVVEGEDESAGAAKEDAEVLRQSIEDLRVVNYVIGKLEHIGKPYFSTDGAIIRARAHVSNQQVERIIGYIKVQMKLRAQELQKRRARQRGKPRPKGKRRRIRKIPTKPPAPQPR